MHWELLMSAARLVPARAPGSQTPALLEAPHAEELSGLRLGPSLRGNMGFPGALGIFITAPKREMPVY